MSKLLQTVYLCWNYQTNLKQWFKRNVIGIYIIQIKHDTDSVCIAKLLWILLHVYNM